MVSSLNYLFDIQSISELLIITHAMLFVPLKIKIFRLPTMFKLLKVAFASVSFLQSSHGKTTSKGGLEPGELSTLRRCVN